MEGKKIHTAYAMWVLVIEMIKDEIKSATKKEKRVFLYVLGVIAFTIFVIFVFFRYEDFAKIIGMVANAVMPFLCGLVVAFILNAFVNLFEGTDAFLHISDYNHERIKKMSDVVKLGDILKVKVTKVDDKGKVNVSRKALLPKPVKKEEEKSK